MKYCQGTLRSGKNGQALLFVVVAMSLALTVGIAISTRTVSSLRRTASTDTASRVLSASEGGIEWFLKQDNSTLATLATGDTSACTTAGTTPSSTMTGACTLKYQPLTGDNITSSANVKVDTFSLNDTASSDYWFNLNPGDVKEIRLADQAETSYWSGTIKICWRSLTAQPSGLYILTYSKSGVLSKNIIAPFSPSGLYNSTNVHGDTPSNAGSGEYTSCYSPGVTVNAGDKIIGLRIKSLYAQSKVAIYPNPTAFPIQGYKITSVGQVENISDNTKATKIVTVYRSYAYAPAAFDYALYSTQPID